ncbi:MAG: MG2 domain-containing protein [Pyrinomonadaceae bacterium]|nr:MG2 domain-containing protein [Pyrinomonadaceae bacterium]
MNIKTVVAFLVIFSIWTSLFAPFVSAQTTENGLSFRIAEAKKSTKPKEKPTPAKVEKLNETEANEIFRRLPPMLADQEENADFKMLSDSLKPPKSGTITKIKFPADEKKDTPNLTDSSSTPIKDNLLEIENFTPNGNVENASYLSVSFSQPMISVTSQTIASENVPIKLTPEVKGKWRWIGTQTLVFDAETRFPMATKFTAKIPANTKSAIGGKLAKDFTWTFSTPPPKVEAFAPKNNYQGIFPENVIVAAKFNQEIDGKAVLPKIRVIANNKVFPIKLVTDKVHENYTVYQELGEVKPKHWLAFQITETLPINTEVKVIFEKGVPSAEGSATSETQQSFTFKTLETFKLTEALCGYVRASERQCQPSDDFSLRLNRSLYPAKIDTSLVKIEPPIENAVIEKDGSGSEIYIKGKKKPNTSYKITLSGEAIDYYKQKIGQDISATFNVGVEQPQFFSQGGNFITLDPNAKPIFSVYTKNHPSFKIRIYSVTPEDFGNYLNFLDQIRNNGRQMPTVNFGKLILDKTVEPKSEIDVLTETRINLSEAIPNKFGHAFVIAEPLLKNDDNLYQYYNQPIITWLQATNIGIDSFIDYEKLNAFISDLKTGKPISNADVKLLNANRPTNENGLVEFNAKTDNFEDYRGNIFISAKNGDDSAIFYYGFVYWQHYGKYDSFRWYVFDDRKMYRPNEEVSLKGYIRQITGGKFTDIAEIGEKVKSVNYVLRDPRNIQIAKGTVQLNTFGAFDFKVKLPGNINLGYQRLEFWSNNNNSQTSTNPEFSHNFQVQEFRRPEFEVSVESETAQPYFVGKPATIYAEAKYYTGGFLQNSPINWDVCAYQTSYSPPNNEEFTFGTFISWWKHYDALAPRFTCGKDNYRLLNQLPNQDNQDNQQNIDLKTDENGKHRINLDFLSANPARPYTLRATAQIEDVNRQVIADTKNFLVHPADFYVGLRAKKTFIRQDEPLTVEAIATDIDGKKIANASISMKAELKDWQRTGSSWQQVTIDTQTCNLTSTDSVNSCNFTAKQGGTFTITATVFDTKERPNTSEITIWVAGGNTAPKRGVEKDEVELIPDKREYSPDETAEILVNSPYESAEGVMTLERNGIIKTEHFTIDKSSAVLKIPIEERYLPNFHVKVDLVSIADRTSDKGEPDKNLPKRPAFATGEINLNVSKASRKLNVLVEPTQKIIEPSGKTNINIEVKDNLGNAVANSEVALIVIDESVLALSDYKIQNPLDVFYQPIQAGVNHYRSRQNVVLANPNDITTADISSKQIESLPTLNRAFQNISIDGFGGNDPFSKKRNVKTELNSVYKNWLDKDVAYIITPEEKKGLESQINIRRNFDALAMFSPSVITDENGKAVVNIKLPDNLTRYRITAVAVTKSKQFGLGESNITAKQSLQIRPSAPRFMNFGDKAELPIVLQNQSDSPLTINVAIRANNANAIQVEYFQYLERLIKSLTGIIFTKVNLN